MPKGIYVPLSVDFADDPDVSKLARFGRDARGIRDLLVQMWCYCKRNRSDGNVPAEQIGKLVYPDTLKNGLRDADRLVTVNLAKRTPEGYYLPGYLKHNKSNAQIEAESEAKRVAGKKGGQRSGQTRKAEAETKQSASTDEAGCFDETNPETETEFIGQTPKTETPLASVGGERHLTSADGRAIWPTHCLDHRYVEIPGACGGCKRQRESIENTESTRRVELEVAARLACTECDDDGWVLTADGEPTARKCTRHHVRSVSA